MRLASRSPLGGFRSYSVVHRRRCAGKMQQILDLPNTLHGTRPLDECFEHVRSRHLAAQLCDAFLHVDVDLTLRNVGIPEDLGLDLVRERRVIEVLRRLSTMLDLLLHSVGMRLQKPKRSQPASPPGTGGPRDPVYVQLAPSSA